MASILSAAQAPVRRSDMSRRTVLAGTAAGLAAASMPRIGRAAPQGQLTWALHVSLAPVWFDPAETLGIITPFMVLYALHDAMVKPMPGKLYSPSLAESWSVSEDNLTYEFTIRDGAKFHNGEPVTAEDVKFSFERYHGAAHELLAQGVASVDAVDSRHVRFTLKKPWPDFLTFYATSSGAGWIVPKKYVEQVGADGFKKHPLGAGPYKFVSFTPGVELVLEAFDGYWRKTPAVKRIVMKSIPDESTRLAALIRHEVDIAYAITAELAQQMQKTPGLTLKPVVAQDPTWIYFPDQFDPSSPWHDQRVRQAANLALDRDGMNQALYLGYSKITNSIVPYTYEYYWQPPPAVHDPQQASMPSTPTSPRLRCRTWLGSASAPSCSRRSAPGSWRTIPARSCTTAFCAERAAPSATPRPGSPRLSSREALSSMAATPTSTRSTRSRLMNSTRKSARQPWTRCSS